MQQAWKATYLVSFQTGSQLMPKNIVIENEHNFKQ